MELTPKQLAFIILLQQLGVFDIKSGSVLLNINFDGQGQIGSIELTTKPHHKVP